MNNTALYLGDIKLPVNPAGIQYRIPALSARYELVGAGEAEVLAGARLADVKIEGFFPAEPRHYAREALSPGEYIDGIREVVESGEPQRLVYVGEGWDLNMLVSVQEPVFSERGGSMDVDYQLTLRKWVPIEIGLYVGKKGRDSTRQTLAVENEKKGGGTYTVKSGDTLSHIAKYTLGDSGRWREIYALNKDTVKNPNLIYAGQELLLPEGAAGSVPSRKSGSSAGSGTKAGAGSGAGGSASGAENVIDLVQSGGSDWVVGANIAPTYNGAQDMVRAYR